MGVSLERVQNKFACIIGELCSEPLVLSQFAVWLDLRLAEYKAKGSICLECCGDIPSPVWLKGLPLKSHSKQDDSWPPTSFHNSPDMPDHRRRSEHPSDAHHPSSASQDDQSSWHRQIFCQSSQRISSGKTLHQQHNMEPSPYRSSIQPGRSPTTQRNHNTVNRTKAQSQHSPVPPIMTDSVSSPLDRTRLTEESFSDVLIKQEVLEDVPEIIPISLHVHESIQDDSRKRTVSDLGESELTGNQSPSKHKKMSPSDNSTSLSTTPDLSSIIGMQQQSDVTGDSTVGYHTAIKTADDDSDIEELSQQGGSSFHAQSFSHMQTASSQNLDFSSIQTDDDSELSRLSQSGDWSGLSAAEPGTSVVRASRQLWMTNSASHHARPRSSGQDKPETTRHKTASALANFQRWFRENTTDGRHMEVIPPDQLDDYLVKFFSTVRKIDGGEYSPKSLKTLREGLERHLKEQGYPVSITTSPLFSRSQEAYKRRMLYLTQLQVGS